MRDIPGAQPWAGTFAGSSSSTCKARRPPAARRPPHGTGRRANPPAGVGRRQGPAELAAYIELNLPGIDDPVNPIETLIPATGPLAPRQAVPRRTRERPGRGGRVAGGHVRRTLRAERGIRFESAPVPDPATGINTAAVPPRSVDTGPTPAKHSVALKA